MLGLYIRIERLAGAADATVSARTNVGGAFDPRPDVIKAGKVYNVWIDVENRSFDIVGGVQNGGRSFLPFTLPKKGRRRARRCLPMPRPTATA
jgi:hypothetical protein